MHSTEYFKRPPSAAAGQSVGASPWTYTNNSPSIQIITVSGGVVSLIEIDAGAGFIPAIGLAGVYTLFPSQALKITYVISAPVVSMVQI